MPERKRKAESKRRPRSKSRWGWWVVGILLVAGIAVVALPNLRRRYLVEQGAEASFVSDLRSICTANVSYEYAHPQQGYARTLADLGPKDGNYIDGVLAAGDKGGYRYAYVGAPSAGGRVDRYHVSARPQPARAGARSAYMDDGCVIRTTKEDRAATASDPPLE